jgi:hypothetical protein
MRYSLTALSLLLLAGSAAAQEGYSAKSLFFDESDSVVTVATTQKTLADAGVSVAAKQAPVSATIDAPQTEQALSQPAPVQQIMKVAHKKSPKAGPLGASYFIRLKDADGSTHDVLASRTFKSGERFQLGVKVNRPTYVYILNQAPDGTVSQIYPQPSQDNFINAMGVVFLPGKGSFEFDSKPGVEQLLVFLSPEPARGDMTEQIRTLRPDMTSAPPATLHTADAAACPAAATTTAAASSSNEIQLASAGNDYAAKGINFAADESCAGVTQQASNDGYAAKGIVFSDDATPAAGGQVASYVVKRTTETQANLYLKINLVHE